jgi:hypothetical protein
MISDNVHELLDIILFGNKYLNKLKIIISKNISFNFELYIKCLIRTINDDNKYIILFKYHFINNYDIFQEYNIFHELLEILLKKESNL